MICESTSKKNFSIEVDTGSEFTQNFNTTNHGSSQLANTCKMETGHEIHMNAADGILVLNNFPDMDCADTKLDKTDDGISSLFYNKSVVGVDPVQPDYSITSDNNHTEKMHACVVCNKEYSSLVSA